MMDNLLKDKGIVVLVDEFTRLKDVIKRTKKLVEKARKFDRISSSVYVILDEVSDITDDQPKKFVLPIDRYSSGHTDRECWAKLYGKTETEAQAKKDKYFEEFPHQGYNTAVGQSGWVRDEDGPYYYHIYISRMHSCD